MKNNKFANIPPLVENDVTIQDPVEQGNIFNKFFASKSSVRNSPLPEFRNRIKGSPLYIFSALQKNLAETRGGQNKEDQNFGTGLTLNV